LEQYDGHLGFCVSQVEGSWTPRQKFKAIRTVDTNAKTLVDKVFYKYGVLPPENKTKPATILVKTTTKHNRHLCPVIR